MVEKISTWMKQFNPEHIFLWIQVSAIHSANRRFQKRFEILLEVMFSIKDSEFEYNHLSREEYEIFLTTFDLQSQVIFSQLENWQPFEQSKLIPYFYNQKKYYFFYGDLERPYELLNRLGTLINLTHKDLLAKTSPVYDKGTVESSFKNKIGQKRRPFVFEAVVKILKHIGTIIVFSDDVWYNK